MGSAWPTPSSLVVWDRDRNREEVRGGQRCHCGRWSSGLRAMGGFGVPELKHVFSAKAVAGHSPRAWLVLSIWQFRVSAKDIPNTWGKKLGKYEIFIGVVIPLTTSVISPKVKESICHTAITLPAITFNSLSDVVSFSFQMAVGRQVGEVMARQRSIKHWDISCLLKKSLRRLQKPCCWYRHILHMSTLKAVSHLCPCSRPPWFPSRHTHFFFWAPWLSIS